MTCWTSLICWKKLHFTFRCYARSSAKVFKVSPKKKNWNEIHRWSMVLVSQRPRHGKKLKEMCRSCKLWLFSNHRLGEAAVRDLSFHFSIRKVQISIIPHENHENLFRRLIAATRPEMKSHGSSHRHKEQHIAFLIFSTVIFFMGKFSYWMGQAVFHHFFSSFGSFLCENLIDTPPPSTRLESRCTHQHHTLPIISHVWKHQQKERVEKWVSRGARKKAARASRRVVLYQKCFEISSPAFLLSPKSEAISSLLSCCCCWWWPTTTTIVLSVRFLSRARMINSPSIIIISLISNAAGERRGNTTIWRNFKKLFGFKLKWRCSANERPKKKQNRETRKHQKWKIIRENYFVKIREVNKILVKRYIFRNVLVKMKETPKKKFLIQPKARWQSRQTNLHVLKSQTAASHRQKVLEECWLRIWDCWES